MVVGDVTTGTDVLVIGGGPGGYTAAIRAGQLGLDVTLVKAGADAARFVNTLREYLEDPTLLLLE